MSVIGPRPLLVEYLPYYTKEEHHRHDVRPGLKAFIHINPKTKDPMQRSLRLKNTTRILL